MTARKLGKRLVIIGAGVGGCYAAGALSHFFDETLVFDRDQLPDDPIPRAGVSQGPHIHGLLRRPFDIACELFPNFEADLSASGGIKLNYGNQARFHDSGRWQPKRDLGISIYSQSRPLLEQVLRRAAARCPGTTFHPSTTVNDYIIERGVVSGVLITKEDGESDIVDADLVVESGGRGSHILSLLKSHGYGEVDTVEFGVGVAYTSAFFTRTVKMHEEPYAFVIRGNVPNTRSGVMFPIEGDRWVISLSGRFDEVPPAEDEGFFAFAQRLEDPILYETISRERRVSDYSRFMIPRIYLRSYEAMPRFPQRLLPIGDTVTGFNPVYGQGMAVAAQHALAIRDLFLEIAASGGNLADLGSRALSRISEASSTAWGMSAPIDLVYPQTTGERPPDLIEKVEFSRYVRQRIEVDADLHALHFRVMNLLEPGSVLKQWVENNPEIG